KKGKFGVNAFLSGNLRPRAETPFNAERVSYDSSGKPYFAIAQDGSSDIKRHGFQTGIGFDAELSKHNNLNGNISYNSFGVDGRGHFNQAQFNLDENGDSVNQILTRNNNSNSFNEKNIDASLNYKRTFKKEDQELEMGVNTSFARNHNGAANEQYLFPSD